MQNSELKRFNAFRQIFPLVIGLMLIGVPSAQAAFTLFAAANPDPAKPDDLVNVEITVANTDGIQRNGVVIELVYPAGLRSLSESQFDGDCPSTTCTAGELVTWTIGSVPAGGSVTVDLPVEIDSGTGGTVIDFLPVASDSLADQATASTAIQVLDAIRYQLALSEDSDPALAGGLLTYTLTFGYGVDAGAVADSTLSFPLPAGTSFVSATGGGIQADDEVTWDLGFLSPGDSGTRQVIMEFDANLDSGTVVAASAEISAVASPMDMAKARALTVITDTEALALAIEVNTNPTQPNAAANLQITVSNDASFPYFGVVLQARYPRQLASLSETDFDGNCSSTTCDPGERVVWTLGDIPAGGSSTVNLSPAILSTAPGGDLLNFFAWAQDDQGRQARQLDTLRVQADRDYDLAIAEASDPATAGTLLTYKLSFGYRADAGAVAETTLKFPLPEGTSFISANDDGVLAGGQVDWNLGFLNPGDGGVREVTVLLDDALDPGTVIAALAGISAASSPAKTTDAEALTIISDNEGLALAIEANANPVQADERTNLQLTVSNIDPFTHFGVVLQARYPQQLASLSESDFDGNCSSTSCDAQERVTWTLGDIPAGGSVTVNLSPTLLNSVWDGDLLNFFTWVEDDQGNQLRQLDTLFVHTERLYELALAENSDPVSAGSLLTYTLTFGHRVDAGEVNETTLIFPIPEGASFVSATQGGVVNDDHVDWDLGFLNPGDSGIRQVTVQLAGDLDPGRVIAARAEILANSSPSEHTETEAHTVITSNTSLAIAIEANANPVRPNEQSNLQITVSNNDPFPRFGVELQARYPRHLGSLSENNFDGDCGSTTCDSGERISWTLGDIPAGDSVTVDLSPSLLNTAPAGDLLNFYVWAEDSLGSQARQLDTLRIQTDTRYELALNEDSDPTSPGSLLTYTMTFGYRADAGNVNDSTLRFPIPNGTSFVSASDGGTFSNGRVDWSLGILSPGDGGVAEVTVQVDSGPVVEAKGEVFAVATPMEQAIAEADTTVTGSIPLLLNINPDRFGALPDDQLTLLLTVTNPEPFTRFGVILQARYPQQFSSLAESSFDGDCPSTTCTAGERITWTLGDIPAGESLTVDLPPTLLNTALGGDIIEIFAWTKDDQGAQSRAVQPIFVGCLEALDADCDSLPDNADNCVLTANLDQLDTDNDGIGNACDSDINQDCATNFIDLGIMKSVFFTSPASPDWNPNVDLNGDNTVNFIDLGLMKSAFFQPPGPSGIDNVCD